MSFPERIHRGVGDLRRCYNAHLFAALIVSVSLHMALIGLFMTGTTTVGASSDPTERADTLVVLPTPTGMIEQETEVTEVRRFEEKVEESDSLRLSCRGWSALPTAPVSIQLKFPWRVTMSGKARAAGRLVPVADSLLVPDFGPVPSADVRGYASAEMEEHDEVREHARARYTPEPRRTPFEIFDPKVVFPKVDVAAIASRVRYPRVALDFGVEGRAVLKVLVDEQGRALLTSVEQCAGRILDTAAETAVRATRFQPATRDGQPVESWIYIALNFRLD